MTSASPYNLCSRALVRVGANPISSFEDGTAESTAAGQEYELAVEALLGRYRWDFAQERNALVPNGTKPKARFSKAYDLPGGCLLVHAAFMSDGFRPLVYGRQQNTIEADGGDSIVVEYTFRAPESVWPPYFVEALFLKLAASFAMSIARNRDFFDSLEKLAEAEFRKAKLADAQSRTTRPLPRGRIMRARSGSR